ncbi:MAG: hypothetical protein HOV83_34275 [Catenulispora sp.]|nr:hypothetical protein [Catenulispora sp.]
MKVYELGARVYSDPGEPWGRMTQLILAPEDHTVSHAVVYSSEDGRARMVPLSMTRPVPQGIRLSCSADKIETMTSPVAVHLVGPAARKSRSRRGTRRGSGRGSARGTRHVAWWPLTSVGSRADSGSVEAEYPLEADEHLPTGTVAISQQEPVRAADGDVGRMHGLVLADEGYQATHVIVEVKRLFSRRRMAVPVDAVAEFRRAGVRLRWSRAKVRSQPPFDAEDSGRVGGSDG